MKVGADVEDDVAARSDHPRRDRAGPDAGGRCEPALGRAASRSSGWPRSRAFDPYWIEEPTSPDDILGHAAIARAVAPIRVATGEHVHNRVMFKQLLQAERDRDLPDRRLPARRRQRGRRGPAPRGEVRRAGLPARRRRRPVRAGPAPVGRRLHRGQRRARRPDDRVRRPPPRAFPRSGRDRARVVPAADAGPATAARCGPSRSPAIAYPDGAEWYGGATERAGRVGDVRRFGQVIRVQPGSDRRRTRRSTRRRGRASSRRSSAANIRNYSIFRHGATLFALLRVRRRRLRGGHGRDRGGRRDAAVVGAHGRDAGAGSGAAGGQLVARPARGLPHRLTRLARCHEPWRSGRPGVPSQA